MGLLLADLMVVRMSADQFGSPEPRSQPRIQLPAVFPTRDPAFPVICVSLEPTSLASVSGRRVFIATTAAPEAEPSIRAHFESRLGALVTGGCSSLADRGVLAESLARAEGRYDVLVCEIKAAAVDTAVRAAMKAGAETVFVDNRPTGTQFEPAVRDVIDLAQRRAAR